MEFSMRLLLHIILSKIESVNKLIKPLLKKLKVFYMQVNLDMNSGEKQSLPLYTSRIEVQPRLFKIKLLMKYGLEKNLTFNTFKFLDVLPMPIFLRKNDQN